MLTTPHPKAPHVRLSLYLAIAALISLVADGWSGKPSPLIHQLLLVPCSICLVFLLRLILLQSPRYKVYLTMRACVSVLVCFELLSVAMIAAENRHFRQFGYRITTSHLTELLVLTCLALVTTLLLRWHAIFFWLIASIVYLAGALLSIVSFPLNYLRSDMLPVIGWADERLWHHFNPYVTMHAGTRLYDFPYLPGMLVAFLPMIALGVDLRFANLVYLLGIVVLGYWATPVPYRRAAVWLFAGLLLCPFLQYRHDLYLEPHWFMVTLATVLLTRRQVGWSAFVWGVSCAVYQLSWVVVPFFILYCFWSGSWRSAMRAASLTLLGCLTIAGPFLPFAVRQVAHNTVGQWNHLAHALADPMNLSFWLTYLIRPSQLRWVQASVLTALFLGCVLKRRCHSVEDTLRFMVIALALFIPLNVLVDGYFYLTLLVFLLLYTCVANGWWGPHTSNLTRIGPLQQEPA